MRDFLQLVIWQRAHAITLKIYSLTKDFPASEMFGLVSQMRRSSSSIPTNIAEGCGRDTNSEMKRFLIISSGSASELQYQVLLSKDLAFLPSDSYLEVYNDLTELRKMIAGFIKSLNKKPNT